MTIPEDALRDALRARAQALRVPERPPLDRVVELRRRPGPFWLVAAACVALVAAGVLVLAQRQAGDPDPAPNVVSVDRDTTTPAPTVAAVIPDTTIPTPVTNGWVAYHASGGGNYLVRPGEHARRLEVAGSNACPAWSPDGTQLLFGGATSSSDTSSEAELVIVPVGLDGAIGAPTVIALDGFHALDGFDARPCAIWAPDGRSVAFGGTGEVWVVDTHTGAIRRLPDLRPSDLAWRPGTDQLAIAGDVGTNRAARTLSTPVTVYSVSTDEVRQLGSVEAAHLTWSPDGSTLAYQGGEESEGQLRLVQADGSDDRLLVADVGDVMHGIGPVWSPTGDRIVYQRVCDTVAGSPGRVCREEHEAVLVTIADGTETVIEPPQTNGPSGPVWWYPFSVTWSPDGTTLLYSAWSEASGSTALPHGLIAVPADRPTDVTVLTDTSDPVPVGNQTWGRQPG